MPELPEVETVVQDLIEQQIVGAKIVKAALFWPKTIAEPQPALFCKQIVGQEITLIERRGKYILLHVGSYFLFIHLRMSGRLLLEQMDLQTHHERAHFVLDDGRILKFIDQRKFGRIYLVEEASAVLNQLGLDPTQSAFTLPHFKKALERKIKIKSLLLNQKIIAGIGNIYADEALWGAKIHPETPSNKLTEHEIKLLYQVIQETLHSAIANRGTSLGKNPSNFHSLDGNRGENGSHLHVYQKKGSPCPRCQTTLVKIRLGGRGTHLCPICQTK